MIHHQQGATNIMKHFGDVVALSGVPVAIFNWPYWADTYSIVGIIYLTIRICETAAVRKLVNWIKDRCL